jgi:DNA-binding transcriptional regulator LsrR (DeoR family)
VGAILAALGAELLDVLITDYETAEALLAPPARTTRKR